MVEPGRPADGRTDFTLAPVPPPVLGDGPRTPPRREFLSTEHLSTEALAAYVDDALPATGAARARAHLARCPDCTREVAAQRDARTALRASGPIRMPEDLRSRLRELPDSPPPACSRGVTAPRPEPPVGGLRGAVRRLFGRTDV